MDQIVKDIRLFNLNDKFTITELKFSYMEILKKVHPDLNQNLSKEETEKLNTKTMLVMEAYKRLKKYVTTDNVTTLSEKLKQQWEKEDNDIFTLYNPCKNCNGKRTIIVEEIVEGKCETCNGTGKVTIKCNKCNNGTFTKRNGQQVKCLRCSGTGIFMTKRCPDCFGNYYKDSFLERLYRSIFNDFRGTRFIKQKKEIVCPECKGRGKIKFEPLNPVIKKGSILKTIKK